MSSTEPIDDDAEFKRHIIRDGHDAHRDDAQFTEEGHLPFHYQGETFQVYYQVAGDLKSSTRPPLVHVHGGPGYSFIISHTHSDLAAHYGIPVIFYDQTGGGKSTHLPHKPKEFWTFELFCEELKQDRKSTRLNSNHSGESRMPSSA